MMLAVCPAGECQFVEAYYGWQCRNCGLFHAFGTAPWEDSDCYDPSFVDEEDCE